MKMNKIWKFALFVLMSEGSNIILSFIWCYYVKCYCIYKTKIATTEVLKMPSHEQKWPNFVSVS